MSKKRVKKKRQKVKLVKELKKGKMKAVKAEQRMARGSDVPLVEVSRVASSRTRISEVPISSPIREIVSSDDSVPKTKYISGTYSSASSQSGAATERVYRQATQQSNIHFRETRASQANTEAQFRAARSDLHALGGGKSLGNLHGQNLGENPEEVLGRGGSLERQYEDRKRKYQEKEQR